MKAIEELGLNLGLHVTLLPNYSFCTDSFYKKHSRWLKPFKFRKIPAVLFLLHKPSLSSFFLQMKVSKPKRRPLLPSNITSLLRIFFSLELNSTKFRKSLFSRIYLCELCKIYFFA